MRNQANISELYRQVQKNSLKRTILNISEKLGKNADMGDYIDDFQKSDAPQFKGASKEKRRKMAIAAYLDAKGISKEEIDIQEDGHVDVASAVRQCKTITEDAMQMLQKLQTMSPEDALPTWWTNKLAVASNNMNKMRDYLLVPSVSEEVELEEDMAPDEIERDAKKAMSQFNSDMAKIYPSSKYFARATTAPMGGGISFEFAVIPTSQAKGVDLRNAPAHSKFMMHLTDGFGKKVPLSKVSIQQIMGRLPTKFRKITARTPTDAVSKMVDFFKKNKSDFESLVKEEVELVEKDIKILVKDVKDRNFLKDLLNKAKDEKVMVGSPTPADRKAGKYVFVGPKDKVNNVFNYAFDKSINRGNYAPATMMHEEVDLDEAKGTTKYVVMQGPGDNNQKVIATFDGGPKALEKAKKFRDDWNKKNKSKIKLNKKGKPIAAHMARIFDKGVETSYKVGDKVSYSEFAPSIIKDEVELDEEPSIDTKKEYLVLIDKDNKIVAEFEGKDPLKDAKDSVRSAHLPPMRIPKNEVSKMRIVRVNKAGRDKKIGDKLGALTKGLQVKVGKMELDEAEFKVNYSKDGKSFEKIINARNEDDAEKQALRKFKIDSRDIFQLEQTKTTRIKMGDMVKIFDLLRAGDDIKIIPGNFPSFRRNPKSDSAYAEYRVDKDAEDGSGTVTLSSRGFANVTLVKKGNKVTYKADGKDIGLPYAVRFVDRFSNKLNVYEALELDEKFTKKDFQDNEDANNHTENGVKLVNMYGTPAEKKLMAQIAKNHDRRGSIEKKEQELRDKLVKKYYPKLESVELDESKEAFVMVDKAHNNKVVGIYKGPDMKKAEKNAKDSFNSAHLPPMRMDKKNLEIKKVKISRNLRIGQPLGEEVELEEKIAGLVNKSKQTGVPYGILKKSYDRGMAAWKTGHRPGTTPQQWAMARVNSMLTGGKADPDLQPKVKAAKKAKKTKKENFGLEAIKEMAKSGKFTRPEIKKMIERNILEQRSASGYELYHKSFSDAMQHAYAHAKSKMGMTVDPDEIDNKVATGPKKPGTGKTNRYSLKTNKGILQIQVYNRGGSKPFELNMYS